MHAGGAWVEGEGHTPSWNRAIHAVDAEGLALEGGRLAGFTPRPGTPLTVGEHTAPFVPLPTRARMMKGMTMVFRSSGTFYTPSYAIDVGAGVGDQDGRMMVYFTPIQSPASAHREWLDRIRLRRDMLERVVAALPESYPARRARACLEALEASEDASARAD